MVATLNSDRNNFSYFDLQVNRMRLTKFQVNWPFSSGEEAKIDCQHGGHVSTPRLSENNLSKEKYI